MLQPIKTTSPGFTKGKAESIITTALKDFVMISDHLNIFD